MRIGINARYLQREKYSGIEIHTLELIYALSNIDKSNEYFLFFSKDRPIPNLNLPDNFKICISNIPKYVPRLAWDLIFISLEAKTKKVEVMHSPFLSPIIKTSKNVLTVYDLAYLYFPQFYTTTQLLVLKYLLHLSIKFSDIIITPSTNTKNDLMKEFGIEENKIKVAHPSVDPFFREDKNPIEIQRVKNKYGIAKEFILNVGVLNPRKNQTSLIKAFRKVLDSGFDYQLVIVGERGWKYNEVFDTVKSERIERYVIFTGNVPKSDLLYLYNGALMFVFPSVYEGFGFPALEAMACGCPTVVSNSSSLPEICNKAALYFDPTDISDIYTKILEVIKNAELRKSLSENGKKQAIKFSRESFARKMLEAYGSLKN